MNKLWDAKVRRGGVSATLAATVSSRATNFCAASRAALASEAETVRAASAALVREDSSFRDEALTMIVLCVCGGLAC